jgi:hypothetical protein
MGRNLWRICLLLFLSILFIIPLANAAGLLDSLFGAGGETSKKKDDVEEQGVSEDQATVGFSPVNKATIEPDKIRGI